MDLADMLIKKGVLKNPRLIEAFRKVDRGWFVMKDEKDYAYIDEPLPIGEGQTISQPWTVAFMLELLNPKPRENVMEIGYGSGWVTALLAACGANIWAIERVPKLCEWGKENFEKFWAIGNILPRKRVLQDLAQSRHGGTSRAIPQQRDMRVLAKFAAEAKVHFFCQDGTLGLPEISEKIGGFDKIIAAAAVLAVPISHRSYLNLIPQAWRDQLKIGGKIVAPVGHSIFEFTKKSGRSFDEREHPGFAFVPLVRGKIQ